MSTDADIEPGTASHSFEDGEGPSFCEHTGCTDFAQLADVTSDSILKLKYCAKHEAAALARGESPRRTPVLNIPDWIPPASKIVPRTGITRQPKQPSPPPSPVSEIPASLPPTQKELPMPKATQALAVVNSSGTCIGRFTSAAVLAKELGVTPGMIYFALSKGSLVKGFTVERTNADVHGWINAKPEIPAGRVAKKGPRAEKPAKVKRGRKPKAAAVVSTPAVEVRPSPSNTPAVDTRAAASPLAKPADLWIDPLDLLPPAPPAFDIAPVLAALGSIGRAGASVEDVELSMVNGNNHLSLKIKRIAFGERHADN